MATRLTQKKTTNAFPVMRVESTVSSGRATSLPVTRSLQQFVDVLKQTRIIAPSGSATSDGLSDAHLISVAGVTYALPLA